MVTLKKPIVASEKRYSFENISERVKKANGLIYKALKENKRKQNEGLQYAAFFIAN